MNKSVVGILGGTGKEGSGLAFRWALAGRTVMIGSRSLEKATESAASLNGLLAGRGVPVSGGTLGDVAATAEVIVLAVPYAAQLAVASEVRNQLDGKVLIDVTVPLRPPKVDEVHLPPGGSAVAALQQELGGGVRVVSAFQNISAVHLKDAGHAIDCDVLVCGDDEAARETTVQLAEAAGFRAWHAGPLANSAAAEALTSVLVAINKRYKIRGAGIRITGAPKS